jgi:hypothetical protein
MNVPSGAKIEICSEPPSATAMFPEARWRVPTTSSNE